jgi:hypothetical protein
VEREVDIALGLVTAGMLAGRKAARAGLAPARVAYRSPLGAPWRGVVTGLGDSGASTRRRGEAQLREAFDRALDRALAGPSRSTWRARSASIGSSSGWRPSSSLRAP